jgi:hypothetical protein
MYNVTCTVHTLLTICFLTLKQAQCTCVTVHSKAINKLYGSVILYNTYIAQYILLYISNFTPPVKYYKYYRKKSL